jgi:hypothetical protein
MELLLDCPILLFLVERIFYQLFGAHKVPLPHLVKSHPLELQSRLEITASSIACAIRTSVTILFDLSYSEVFLEIQKRRRLL